MIIQTFNLDQLERLNLATKENEEVSFSKDVILDQAFLYSIATHGIKVPLMVTELGDHRYGIIKGERRFEAAKMHRGKFTEGVPCIVIPTKNMDELHQMRHLFSLAKGYKEKEGFLYVKYVIEGSDEGTKDTTIAAATSYSKQYVGQVRRVLENPYFLELVLEGAISATIAYAIITSAKSKALDPKDLYVYMLSNSKKFSKRNVSTAALELAAQNANSFDSTSTTEPTQSDGHIHPAITFDAPQTDVASREPATNTPKNPLYAPEFSEGSFANFNIPTQKEKAEETDEFVSVSPTNRSNVPILQRLQLDMAQITNPVARAILTKISLAESGSLTYKELLSQLNSLTYVPEEPVRV